MITTEAAKVPPQYRKAGFFGGSFLPEPLYYGNEGAYQVGQFSIENRWTEKYCIEPYKYLNKLNMGEDLYNAYIEDYAEVSGSINAAISDFANRSWRGEISDMSSSGYNTSTNYILQVWKTSLRNTTTTRTSNRI